MLVSACQIEAGNPRLTLFVNRKHENLLRSKDWPCIPNWFISRFCHRMVGISCVDLIDLSSGASVVFLAPITSDNCVLRELNYIGYTGKQELNRRLGKKTSTRATCIGCGCPFLLLAGAQFQI